MTDAASEIRKEQVKYGGPPKLPSNADEPTRDLYKNLRSQVEGAPRGTPEHDEPLLAIHRLVEELQGQLPTESPWGNLKGTVEFTDPEGRPRIQQWDDRGNVVEVPIDTSEAEQQVATMKLRTDEREAVRRDLQEVARIQEFAVAIQDPIAVEELRARADELHQKAQERLEKLREAVPPEEWPQYGLGVAPALSDEERQAIELAKNNQAGELADVWMDLSPEQQQQVLHAVPPEQTGWLESLIRHVEAGEE